MRAVCMCVRFSPVWLSHSTASPGLDSVACRLLSAGRKGTKLGWAKFSIDVITGCQCLRVYLHVSLPFAGLGVEGEA